MNKRWIVTSMALALLLAISAVAQTTHKVSLTWQESVNADVYRAQSGCDAAGSFVKVATAVPSGFVDTAVATGATYCYYVIELPSNVPSNLVEVVMPGDAVVSIKAAKQTAGAEAQ